MDTLEFFQTVLPEDSIHYLVLFTKKLDERGHPFKIHKPFSDLETMAAAMEEFDDDEQSIGVYHACGGYLKPVIELDELNKWGKPKRQFRVPDNWNQAKAFWIDVDCRLLSLPDFVRESSADVASSSSSTGASRSIARAIARR